MPKNTKGGKNFKKSKRNDSIVVVHRTPEPDLSEAQILCIVTKVYSRYNFEVAEYSGLMDFTELPEKILDFLNSGPTLRGILTGTNKTLRKQNCGRVQVSDLVLVGFRIDFSVSALYKVDIMYKYTDDDIQILMNKRILPVTFNSRNFCPGGAGNDDDGIIFDRNDTVDLYSQQEAAETEIEETKTDTVLNDTDLDKFIDDI